MVRKMDLRQLKYFIAVAQERNIGRAAERLHISQPPLTRQIKQLEEDLGAELLVRTPKGVELTEAGQALLHDALSIRRLVDQTSVKVRRIGQGQLGPLHVGVFGSSILNVVPRILSAFKETHPEVDVVLHVAYHEEQIEALRQGRITLVLDRYAPEEEDLRVEFIASEPVVVALNRRSPLAHKRMITIEMLRDEPMVMPEGLHEWSTNVTLRLFRAHGHEPAVSQQATDVITSIAMVGAGFGSCLVPLSASSLQLPNVVYRRLKEGRDEPYRLYCFFLKDAHSPALFELLDIAKKIGKRISESDDFAVPPETFLFGKPGMV